MDWPLLKHVSRSFYLTLRLLPKPVREPISLAYLLARLTDTLADGVETPAEAELVQRRAEIESWLEASPDRAAIEKVWRTIREGQDLDKQRFPSDAPLSEEELERYTYLVAGCVGEFWTTICAEKLPGFAARPVAEMTEMGIRFGKGLQLVNILRDRARDLAKGRNYFSSSQFESLLALAREHLAAGRRYVQSLRNRRLRTACALPFLLAEETLDLVERKPDVERVKVSRFRVWILLGRSLFF